MINMKLLEVVTPPSIYYGCSTWKTFWEEKFTSEEKLFSAVNMNNCGGRNVRKHKDIKGSDKYVTLDISLKFDSLDNKKITSSKSKGKFGNIRKGVDYLSGFQGQSKAAKIKRQGIPSEMSVRNIFPRILGSLRKLRNYLMIKRGPNMSLLTATFT